MKSMLDSQAITIPCPNCGHQLSQTIGKLKTDPELTCTKCSTRFKVDATDMRREIAKVENALANLRRTLGKVGK